MSSTLNEFINKSSHRLYRRKHRRFYRLPADLRWLITIRNNRKYVKELFGDHIDRSDDEINSLINEFLNG